MNVTGILKGRLNRKGGNRHSGAAMTELLVSLPALLLMGLGGLQTALIYDAKTTINYATFEAARVGAVEHAQSGAIRQELGVRLAPLYGGDGSPRKAIAAMTRSSLEVQDRRFTRIEILNPTVEAFEDFGREIVDPRSNEVHFGIPNSHLRWRDQQVRGNSGVSIQDANLLKVKTTYGYELKVPLMDHVIPAVMSLIDPENSDFYASGRLPITAVATVRMQSDAWRDENDVHTSDDDDGGASPPSTGEGGGATDPAGGNPSDGQGGEDDSSDTSGGEDDSDSSGQDGESGSSDGGQDGTGQDGSGQDGSGQDGSGQDGSGQDGTSQDGDEFTDDLEPIDDGDDMGIPSCRDETAQGDETYSPTAQTSGLSSTYVGNPIHVVTGNKYQQEVDLLPLPGELGLLFKRHYNSHSDEIGPLGHGWSHSYDLQVQPEQDGYRLRQSDGRVIHFRATDKEGYFSARRVSDGWLRVNREQLTWHWRDGRQLQFSPQGQLQRIVLATGLTTSLFYNSDGELFLVRDPQGRELSLDHYPNGRIKAVYDPNGQATRYSYDLVGNLQRVIRSDGSKRIYHYDDPHDKHNLTGITDERGVRYATWAYDSQDRAVLSTHAGQVGQVKLDFSSPGETRITDSQGEVSTYTTEIVEGVALVTAIHGPGCSSCGQGDVQYRYNKRLQLSEVTTRDGITKHYRYDAQDRLIQIVESADEKGERITRVIAKYAYLGDSVLPVVITEPSVNPERMHQWWLAYTAQGQLKEIDELGYSPDFKGGFTEIERITRYAYQDGLLASVDGPMPGDADLRVYHYDNKRRLQRVESKQGAGPSIEAFDAYGRPSRIRDQEGSLAELKYDAAGRILAVKRDDQVNGQATFEYDSVGNIVAAVGPKGRVEVEYDEARRPVAVVFPNGQRKTWEWDTENRVLRQGVQSSAGDQLLVMTYLYDQHGDLIEEHSSEGDVSQYAYDGKGRLQRFTDPLGITTDYVTDPFKHVIAIIRAAGTENEVTESLEYGAHDLPIAMTDGRGNTTRLALDDFGHRLWRETPDGGNVLYQYNALGLVAAKVDETGVVTRYDYDENGRLVGVGGFNRPPTIKLDYLSNGKPVKLEGLSQSTQYAYGEQGKIREVSVSLKGLDRSYVTQYQYDKQGRVVEKVMPGGQTLLFEYPDQETMLPVRVVQKNWINNQSLIDKMDFDQQGRIKYVGDANGQGTSYRYDTLGRLSRIDGADGSFRQYAYDSLDRLISVKDNEQASNFGYDVLGRLDREERAGYTQKWRYDKAGNRIEWQQDDVITSYRYDPNSNRLIEAGDLAFAYNSTGAPVRMGELRYEYNTGGRPQRVFRGDELIAEYTYNSQGERIKKVDHRGSIPKVTYYLYEAKRLAAELDEAGEVSVQYLYLGGRPIAMLKGDRFYTIQVDHRDAPVLVTDDQGTVVWHAEYDPFGQATVLQSDQSDAVTLNLRLPGQYFDAETGTHYNLNRDYDPRTGRYLTSDPLGSIDGLNTYAYVDSDPLNRIDPLGLYSEDIHYYMVNFLASVAGLDSKTVGILSTASQYIDDNSITSPMNPEGIARGSLENYHFILPREDETGQVLDFHNPSDPQLDRLRDAAMSFNYDGCTLGGQHTRYVKAQLYGEYLHAYADTYGHRDSRNNPYSPTSARGGLGHALDLTWPDRTDNFRVWIEIPLSPMDVYEEWNYQEVRTLEAEKQMFYQIRADFKTEIEATRMQAEGPGATAQTDAEYQAETDRLWREMAGDGDAQVGQFVHGVYHEAQGVTGVLQQFNATHADSTEQTLEEKRRILGQWLIDTSRASNMLSLAPGAAFLTYNESIGRVNRNSLLGEFEPGDLPGVLLPYHEPDIEVNGP